MRSILLVDDDLAVREAIRLNLELAGYAVMCASDGVEAEQILDRERVDVLLTDILMPNRDGLELIGAVHEKHPETRIIAMSGGGIVTAELCLKFAQGFHVDGFLRKPFAIEEMLSLLRAILARANTSEA